MGLIIWLVIGAITLLAAIVTLAFYTLAHPILTLYSLVRLAATIIQFGFTLAGIVLLVAWVNQVSIPWYAWAAVFGGGALWMMLRHGFLNPFIDNLIANGGLIKARQAAQFQRDQEEMIDQWRRQQRQQYAPPSTDDYR